MSLFRLSLRAALVAGALLLAFEARAEPPTDAQICEAARKETITKPRAARVFSIVPRGNDPDAMEGPWKEFPDFETRNRLAEKRPIYDSAATWIVSSGFLFVSTHSTSPSGDWNHYVDYCYRKDGTLAWMESELRTFYGGVRRVRARLFGADGKVISKTVHTFDLSSGKPVKDPSFMDQDEPVYLRPEKLPFARLLAPTRK